MNNQQQEPTQSQPQPQPQQDQQQTSPPPQPQPQQSQPSLSPPQSASTSPPQQPMGGVQSQMAAPAPAPAPAGGPAGGQPAQGAPAQGAPAQGAPAQGAPAQGAPAFAPASLYVGDLDPSVTERHLFEIFAQTGPVASIKVCRDAMTRRSLGYAYVNYHRSSDAERALDLLNYREIKGKPCRIMWSRRDPSLRRTNRGNIFVKNLEPSIDHKALYDTFADFGNILSCKVALDINGKSKGHGFVHYETEEMAQYAIDSVNGMLLNGRQVYVAPFVPSKEREGSSIPKWCNLYVKNLDESFSEEKLSEIFTAFGDITSAVLQRNEDGSSAGFGFVCFKEHESAAKALDSLNGNAEVEGNNGKEVYVGVAQKKAERRAELASNYEKISRERMSKYQGVNLYVKNLDDSIDDERLRQEFAPHGTISSAVVMKDEKGVSKGFGFVCYTTPDEATKAVTEMNGKLLESKPIYVALAQRKEQRRAQLEVQHAQRASGIRMQQVQAQGVGNPMYGGTPVFYAPGGMGRGGAAPGGFITSYPQQAPNPNQPLMQRGPQRFPQQPPFPQAMAPAQYMMQPPLLPQQQQPLPQQRPPPQPQPQPQPSQTKAPAQTTSNYPGIKFNPTVRNPTADHQLIPQEPAPAPAPPTAVERKRLIGEKLFTLIQSGLKPYKHEEQAGKITGMLLESMDQEDLLKLLDSPEALDNKIKEGLEVLENAGQLKQAQADQPDSSTV